MILDLLLHLRQPPLQRLNLNEQVCLPISDEILWHEGLLAVSLRGSLALTLLLERFNNGLLVPNHLLLLLDLELQQVVFLFQVKHTLRQLVELLRVQILGSPGDRVRVDLVS